jgi:selenide, water dikinase
VLRHLPKFNDPNLIFGYDTVGDAGVYKISNDVAIVQTVDILTPIADDAFTFGEIAAANSLSDLYVMGAKPITALNIVGFPEKLDLSYLEKIIQGGTELVKKAGAVMLGGHTIKDEDLKYGLAVTGIVHPDKLITNENCQPGDKLILTKPLGTGVISTALKKKKASEKAIEKINKSMRTLNNVASEAMVEIGVNGCTDVTGFGLLGHALQLAQASNVSLKIDSKKVPTFEEAKEYATKGFYPGGTLKNEKFVRPSIEVKSTVNEIEYMLLCDAQTSGGLLISVEKLKGEKLLHVLRSKGIASAEIIGEVIEKKDKVIYVV